MPQTSAAAQSALVVLMFATGIGIPIMAALSAGLAGRIGSPTAAAFILFLVAAAISGIALLASLPGAKIAPFVAPPQFYLGGFFVAAYVLSVTFAAPRIGVGNAVFFVLLGQLVAAASIDHFGLFGAPVSPITLKRAAGLALMAAGVFLARKVA